MTAEDWSKDGDDSGDAVDVGSRDGLEIEVRRPAQRVVLLTLAGEIDLWTSFPLMEAILDSVHEHPALIAVDLSDAWFTDAAGPQVLLEGARRIGDGRTRFALICPAGSQVARLLEETGVHRALNVHESVDDALGPWLDEAGELPAGV
jgi:anti-anti-sigma factor